MRVGLHQRERDPLRLRRERDRAGDVAAAAEHDVRPASSHDPEALGDGSRGERERLHQATAGPPRQPLDPELLELEARRGHERGLRPFGAGEDHLGAAGPKRLGDGERRHDVSGCPAGGDQAHGLALRLLHG